MGLDGDWRLACSGAELMSFVFRLKSAEKLNYSSPMGIGSADNSRLPKGGIASTVQIYFQIIQTGSSTVTSMYQHTVYRCMAKIFLKYLYGAANNDPTIVILSIYPRFLLKNIQK